MVPEFKPFLIDFEMFFWNFFSSTEKKISHVIDHVIIKINDHVTLNKRSCDLREKVLIGNTSLKRKV